MRARAERDQPQPVARAAQVVGRLPARGRRAQRAPGRVIDPVVDVEPRVQAKPHGVRVVGVVFGEIELAFEQAGAAGGVDHPTCADGFLLAELFDIDAVAALAITCVEIDAPHRRRQVNPHTAAHRLFGKKVLEQAAVDLPARRGEETARAELGHRRQVGLAFAEEESEAELAQVRLVEMGLQAQRLRKVVRADLDTRLADLVRRHRHRVAAALDHAHVELGHRLLELQRQRQPGQATAEDQDVVHRIAHWFWPTVLRNALPRRRGSILRPAPSGTLRSLLGH